MTSTWLIIVVGLFASLCSIALLLYAIFFLKRPEAKGEIFTRKADDEMQRIFLSKIQSSDIPDLFKMVIAKELPTIALIDRLNQSSLLPYDDLLRTAARLLPETQQNKPLAEMINHRITTLEELGLINSEKIKDRNLFSLTGKGLELYEKYNVWVKQPGMPMINSLMQLINAKLDPLPEKYDISIISKSAIQLSELSIDIQPFSYNGCRNWVNAISRIRQFVMSNLADPHRKDLRVIHEREYRFFYAAYNKFLSLCAELNTSMASDSLARLHQKVNEYQELYSQLKRSELELGQTSSEELFMEKHKAILGRVFYETT